MTVDESSCLEWMPQETILFEGSALQRRLHVDLAPSSRFLMVEPLVFGRVLGCREVVSLAPKLRLEVSPMPGALGYAGGIALALAALLLVAGSALRAPREAFPSSEEAQMGSMGGHGRAFARRTVGAVALGVGAWHFLVATFLAD